MTGIKNSIFQVVTLDGETYTEGDPNPSTLGDPAARLEHIRYEGDLLFLSYGTYLDISMPASRVRHIAAGPARAATTTN